MSKNSTHAVETHEPRTGYEAKRSAVVLLRWVLVIASSAIILFTGGNEDDRVVSHLSVLVLVLSNIFISLLPTAAFASRYFDPSLVTVDIVLVSCALWLSGHVSGDFYLLYFLIIMIAAIGETLRSIIWSACLVSAVYLGLSATHGGANEVLTSEVLIRIPFFFIVAIFYGYFTQMVRSERTAKVTFQAKWTIGKRLREFSNVLSLSLDRQSILEALVRAERDLIEAPYCAIVSRGTQTVVAEAGDTSERPDPATLSKLLATLDRRIGNREKGLGILADAPTALVLTGEGRGLSPEPALISFSDERGTFMPVSAHGDSDLYLFVVSALSRELLEYSGLLMMSASLALKNAGQYHALVHEVEKRQIVARELGEALEFKSQFLANISHEIRTPLYSFLGFGELLLGGGYGDVAEEQAEVMGRMMRNARNLLDLINDILDLSKLEAGAMSARIASGSIKEFVRDTFETCQPLLKDKSVSLHSSVQGDLDTVATDWGIVRQITMNLVSNAVKFTNKGRVELTASVGNELRVSVKDTGVGIASEQLAEIFEPFRQLENSYTKRFAGTGLGLAISKRQAELLGGRIEVQSRPGQGSLFTLVVPLQPPGVESDEILPSVRPITTMVPDL